METLRIDKTTFHVPNLKSWTKEDFIKQYEGQVTFDINDAWELIQMRLKQLENKPFQEVFTDSLEKKNVRANKKSL